MSSDRTRLHLPVTLMQAAESSPTLAGLAALAREAIVLTSGAPDSG